ncbi:MAG: methyltransferase, partial [Pseudomonadota bacterium]
RSHPDADLLNLDAVRLDTNRTFDCIYSNKVLHHLDRHDLEQSLVRQRTILAAGGLVFHTFWHGEGVEEHSGLQFNYHSVDSIRTIFASRFETVAGTLYSEMEADDSLYVMARI